MKKNEVRILGFLIFFWFCSMVFCSQLLAITARSAIVMDAENGRILYKKNEHMRLPAASTVKILTAVMAAEQLNFQKKISISKRAAGIAPSKLYLTEKAHYKVEDLMSCFVMGSANDAGVAIAEAMAPTEFRFSLLMNERAKKLGAKNSFFLNATGLPEYKKRQFSSAYDLALFMKECIKFPELVKIMQTKNTTCKGSDGKDIKIRNHNKFLWKNSNDLIGKTGYTRAARHCFLGTFSQGGRKLIVAIQGSKKPWDDLQYLLGRRY